MSPQCPPAASQSRRISVRFTSCRAVHTPTGRGRVKLVAGGPDILETSPPGQRAAARSVLSGKGISVITDGLVRL